MRRVATVIALPVLAAACALITNLDDLGSSADGAPNEASGDAGKDPSVIIASAGQVSTATGNVQQTHLVFAAASKTYVLFYITSADLTHLRTRISPDFVTWSDGASLTLPYTHGSDGREFSVSYAAIAGVDVVHIAMSHEISTTSRKHTHTRAVISPSGIAFGTPEDVTQTSANPASGVNPDAPATLVTTAGVVMDATGWAAIADAGGSTFNSNVFVAKSPDLGGSFASTGWTQWDLEHTARHVNSRELVEIGGQAHAFWDNADVKPDPTNVHVSTYSPSGWSAPIVAFSMTPDAGESEDDWCASTGPSTGIDIVRHTLLGFEHVQGDTSLSPATAIPSVARARGSGVACAFGSPMLATAALDGTIVVSRIAGGTFSPWVTLVPTPMQRAYVAMSPAASGQTAIIWTQISSSGWDIAGTLAQ